MLQLIFILFVVWFTLAIGSPVAGYVFFGALIWFVVGIIWPGRIR